MRGNALFKWVDFWIGRPLLRLAVFRRAGSAAPLAPGGRVLVVKFSAMGDTLLLLPALKALKDQVGAGGRVEMVCTSVNRAVLEGCPWVDAIHLLEPKRLLTRPWELAALLARLRGSRFDWALDFDQWLRISALIAACSGGRSLAGFETPGQGKHQAFDRRVTNTLERHEFEQFKSVAAFALPVGAAIEDYAGFLARHRLLAVAPLDSSAAGLAGSGRLVVFHPGCGEHGWQRAWPVERYAALAAGLRARGPIRIAISGGGSYETALAEELKTAMGGQASLFLDRSLGELASLLRAADLVVCGNTGVMHLAVGLGSPVVAPHGPTSAVKWGPLGRRSVALPAHVPCSPCLTLGFEYGCPERPCMESISAEEALQPALRILDGTL